jgi:DNA-binding transcriptional LysR family regulator
MLTNLNLVAAGIGVSCVPESMRHVATEGIVYAVPEAPAAARKLLQAPLTLIYRADESRPIVRSFIAEAQRLAAIQSKATC